MSVKLDFSEEGKNVNSGYRRRVCWDYLDRRQRKMEIGKLRRWYKNCLR